MKPGNDLHKTLVVITGPTAVGKTQTTIEVAKLLSAEIISADARQFYRELQIGTAAPTNHELLQAPHHFIGHLSIFDYYNASIFEQQALQLLDRLFEKNDFVLLTGGSGLYIDALCYGIDDMPDADENIRNRIIDLYKNEGLHGIRTQLRNIDPEYYHQVDLANPNRIMRGLEVFYTTGIKFSELRKKQKKQRPFQIKKIILNRPRAELFERINQRTDHMIEQGMIEEAWYFFRHKNLNALNTVGYKELFYWIENRWDLKTAIEKIKTNTRRYAKRQLTWFKKDPQAQWFEPHQISEILKYIQS
jgi:tRNA dimethylallyltransferase